MAELDINECFQEAISWAKEGGSMIKLAWERSYSDRDAIGLQFKGTIDLVTEIDKAVEKLITEKIKEKFPTHAILGEEAASEQGTYSLEDIPTWCIDPIDGTTNFVHHFPFSCVSIALCINRQSVLGISFLFKSIIIIIYYFINEFIFYFILFILFYYLFIGVIFNPILDELFTAKKGHGAFLNDRPIHVSNAERIDQSVISTNVGYIRQDDGIDFVLANMKTLLQHNVRSMRSLGSSALEVCSVACGRLDAFYEFGIHAWDVAAAVCILTEAGGVALDPDGTPLDLTSRRILACTPGLSTVIPPLLLTNPPFLKEK